MSCYDVLYHAVLLVVLCGVLRFSVLCYGIRN
jgi:hypothetical protein